MPNFPNSPATGDTTNINGKVYRWTGSIWENAGSGVGPSIKMQIFSANGTYTPSDGMRYCMVEAVGAGGGGGGSDGSSADIYCGVGGGGGGYTRRVLVRDQIGTAQTVTIGVGGTGGTGQNNGTDGSNTSLGTSLVVAVGGEGGIWAGFTQAPSYPANGGIAWTGGDSATVTIKGGTGDPGTYDTTQATPINYGKAGDSFFAQGPHSNRGVGNGYDGEKGAGGAGALSYNTATDYTGGSGGDGYMVITEFLGESYGMDNGPVTVATSPPSSPRWNDIWVRSTDFKPFIYYNDGDSQQWVALTSSTASPNDPSQTLLISGTASSVSTLDFDLRNFGGYRHFKLCITDYAPSVDGAGLWARTSNTASPTALSFDSGASDYSWAGAYFVMFGGVYGTDDNDALDSEIQLMGNIGNATNEIAYSCCVDIPHNTNRTDWPGITFNCAYINSSGSVLSYPHNIAYRRSVGYDILGFRLLTSSGTATFKYELYGVV